MSAMKLLQAQGFMACTACGSSDKLSDQGLQARLQAAFQWVCEAYSPNYKAERLCGGWVGRCMRTCVLARGT